MYHINKFWYYIDVELENTAVDVSVESDKTDVDIEVEESETSLTVYFEVIPTESYFCVRTMIRGLTEGVWRRSMVGCRLGTV